MANTDLIPTTGPDAGLIDLDRVAELLRTVHGIDAWAEHTGGGCAGLYAGTPTTVTEEGYGEIDRYPAAAGPGTYKHRDHGKSVAHLSEFAIGPDDNGESGGYVDAASVGVKTLVDVANLIAAQVACSPAPLGADAIEALGLDPSLRSEPAWITSDKEQVAQQVAEANARNAARLAQNAAALTYVIEPWEV